MKTRVTHCDLRTAFLEAEKLEAQLITNIPGGAKKWSNGREEILFVPDDYFVNAGTLTIRFLEQE